MSADRLAITMYRGDSYPITFTLRDKSTGDLINLTGATVKLTVDSRKEPTDDSTKIFDITGVVDDDPTAGIVVFTPTTTNTSNKGSYYYDVQLTDADNHVRTVCKSTFEVTQDITK